MTKERVKDITYQISFQFKNSKNILLPHHKRHLIDRASTVKAK